MSKDKNYKVYVHINKINGKKYFGITCKKKVEQRWQNGYGYKFYIDKEGNRHGNEHFWNSICKYGWDNFEHIVIAKGLTKAEAEWLEIELIREHDTRNKNKGYNITKGGKGTNGYKHTKETRKKLSEINKGKTLSEESRKKIGEAHRGKVMSEESRKKMSESRKGKLTGKNNPMYGKKHSEETRKKLSEALKGENNPNYGKTKSEETRKKLSEAHKGKQVGKNNPGATKVYCVELDKYFDTVTEASKFVGCNVSNISRVLNGKYKTAGGYHWVYAEDVNEENINKVMSEEYNKGKNTTKVYCIELDKYFDTVRQAGDYVGCNHSNISRVLGTNNTAKGYHWLYAEDVNEENINKVMSLKTGKGEPTKVYCVELDMYFNTITEASKFVGCYRQNISKVLGKSNRTCGGYHWIYAEDVKTIEIENSKVS